MPSTASTEPRCSERPACDCRGWPHTPNGAMAITAVSSSTGRRSPQKLGSNRATRSGLCSWQSPSDRLCGLLLLLLAPRDSALTWFLSFLMICLAGGVREVSAALARLTAAARQVGLDLNPGKCCLTTCSDDGLFDRHFFPAAGMPLNRSGAFTLLGAAVGNRAFCEHHTMTKRVEASEPLLAALGELRDPQTALLLLRECASYCKVVYSSRVTPPSLHPAAICRNGVMTRYERPWWPVHHSHRKLGSKPPSHIGASPGCSAQRRLLGLSDCHHGPLQGTGPRLLPLPRQCAGGLQPGRAGS